jgi:hypothetical protein
MARHLRSGSLVPAGVVMTYWVQSRPSAAVAARCGLGLAEADHELFCLRQWDDLLDVQE